jgi:beta-1,4-mannosyl-glycoprotein beta-1,4-N-acetylglucosaminyltransferase
MKIFDTFLFFNELDLLELRLNVLDPFVDFFVLTEASVTFSGKPKRLYYADNIDRFSQFRNKLIHNIIRDTPNDFLNFQPPNEYYTNRSKSYSHKSKGRPLQHLSLDFQREVFQRDSIINGLLGTARDEDLILISDADEIPNPAHLKDTEITFRSDALYNFCQQWYMYYVNVSCDKEWFGTRACKFRYLRGRSIDLIRHHLECRAEQEGPILENGGWHFSFLGGPDKIKQKLEAYSYQGRRSQLLLQLLDRIFKSRIKRKIDQNQDIFNMGRQFHKVILDSSFPEYLIANLDKYKAYIK